MLALLLVKPEHLANSLPQCFSSHAKHLLSEVSDLMPNIVSIRQGNQQFSFVHLTFSAQQFAQSFVIPKPSKHGLVSSNKRSTAQDLASSVSELVL